MTDTTLPPGDEAGDRIEPVDIQQEMQRSYIDYAMSVIVGRALPEVRDGLKPVHRRVLYAMYDSGFRPDRSHAKSARSVAETMGNYHPHGDASIYDTLVRMAQPWSLRYPLVDGQGNFGSPGNDPPAAMRYTEARLTPLAMEMLREIDEETVDFIPNYDGRVQEPTVLPSRFPNLLANGSGGIAVGMATNIPPHNLGELAEAVYWCLENHEADEEATLAAVCERVKGPDFPTAGLIVGSQGISRRLHHRAAARFGCAAWWRSRKTRGAAPASSSPSCRIRSTTTTSSPRSPSRSATASWPASPTSKTRAATASACASWSSSSATRSRRWC